MLKEKRRFGKLLQGCSKTIELNGGPCKYEGETDIEGNAFGVGIAVDDDGNTFSGTFVDNKLEGICSWHHKATDIRDEGEYKAGRSFGKKTEYLKDGKILNRIHDIGECIKFQNISIAPTKAFYIDGRPTESALDRNLCSDVADEMNEYDWI